MDELSQVIFIFLLFYLLGKTAEVLVSDMSIVSKKLGIPMVFFGLILGFFTSFPELGIAINAFISNVQDISMGNLLGGPLVMIGLIFGISVLLNKRVRTDGKFRSIIPVVVYTFLPFLFGIDGAITRLEGLALIVGYFALVYIIYLQQKRHNEERRIVSFRERIVLRELFRILLAIIFILALSNLLVGFAEGLLKEFHLQGFLLGIILFAVGTNLPEIIIMIHSWKKGIKELAMNHLLGSIVVDFLIIGVFAFLRPITFTVSSGYVNSMLFTALLLTAFVYFYKTDKVFTRIEGLSLFFIYAVFLTSELYFLFER
jgi:cation:H+ antiporter